MKGCTVAELNQLLSLIALLGWSAVALVVIPRLQHANGQSRIIRATLASSLCGIVVAVAFLVNVLGLVTDPEWRNFVMLIVRAGLIGMAAAKLWLVQAWRR